MVKSWVRMRRGVVRCGAARRGESDGGGRGGVVVVFVNVVDVVNVPVI